MYDLRKCDFVFYKTIPSMKYLHSNLHDTLAAFQFSKHTCWENESKIQEVKIEGCAKQERCSCKSFSMYYKIVQNVRKSRAGENREWKGKKGLLSKLGLSDVVGVSW